VGKNFIPQQTIIFFDLLWQTEINVLSPTEGTFIAPSN